MNFRSTALVSGALLVLLSCSGEAPSSEDERNGFMGVATAEEPPEAPPPDVEPASEVMEHCGFAVAPEPRAPRDGDVLVWIHRAPEFTARIDGTTGEVLETTPEVQIAAGGRTWTFASEQKAVTIAEPCDPRREEESATTRLTVTSGDDVRELEPFVTEKETDGLVQIKHEAELVASVGPYAFVRTWRYVDACGAHGSVGASAHVVDIASGAEVELAGELGPETDLAREAAGKIEDTLDDELPRRTELLPQIGDDGRLHVGRKFTAFACYACSDGEWSSYSRSVVLSARTLPRSLAPYAHLPKGLARFHAENPTWKIGGFSVVGR